MNPRNWEDISDLSNSLASAIVAGGAGGGTSGTGLVKVVQGQEKRKGDIPLIDEVEEEVEEAGEEKELTPPLAEAESSQLSSLESVKIENKIILSQENQVLEQTDDQQRVKVFELFKSLPLCSDVAITE